MQDFLHQVNWSPTHSTGPQTVFFYRYLSIGRSNQRNQKNNVLSFLDFAPGRTLLTQSIDPQPIQLVSIPSNWSPNSVSYRYLSIGRSNQKKSKNNIHLFLNFASCRTLFTKSTGPQPIQLVPNSFSYRYLGIGRSIKKNQKTISIYF